MKERRGKEGKKERRAEQREREMLHSKFSGNNYTQKPPYEINERRQGGKKHYLRIFIRNKIMDSAENENVQRVQFACVCEIGMVS